MSGRPRIGEAMEREKARQKARQKRRDEDNRHAAASKKAAGLTMYVGRHLTSQAEEGFHRQIPLMPDDTRTLTARMFGDPVPNDPRAPWRPQFREVR